MARKKNIKSTADTSLANPQNRTEEFLAKIAGLTETLPEGEFSRLERYLKVIASNPSGSGMQASAYDPDGTVAEAGGIPAYVESEVDTKTPVVGKGKNIFYNWYFCNPVQQKSYSGSPGYLVDGWFTGGGVTLSSQYGFYMPANTYINNAFDDNIKNFLDGKKVTVSFLTWDGAYLASGSVVYEKSPSSDVFFYTDPLASIKLATNGTFALQTGSTTLGFCIAKLELGDEQTVARQVDGVWVPNDVPNYDEELCKCQRYLVELNPYGKTCGVGIAVAKSSSVAQYFISTPVTLQKSNNLAITKSGTISLVGSSLLSVDSFTNVFQSGNGVSGVLEATGLTAGSVYVITMGSTDSRLTISAE